MQNVVFFKSDKTGRYEVRIWLIVTTKLQLLKFYFQTTFHLSLNILRIFIKLTFGVMKRDKLITL